jgi:tetratricopeptide (TPR) repeat protein
MSNQTVKTLRLFTSTALLCAGVSISAFPTSSHAAHPPAKMVAQAEMDAQSLVTRSSEKYDSGDHAGALVDVEQAIKLEPERAAAYFMRGIIRRTNKDAKGAFADFDQVVQLDPKWADAYNSRGAARMADNDSVCMKPETFADFEQAIKVKPDFAAAYYNRGQCRFYKGDKAGAIKDLDQAIKLNPQFSEAYEARGYAKSNLGDRKGAQDDFGQGMTQPKALSIWETK